MKFKEESVDSFLSLFDEYKSQIRSSEGCLDLKLIHDVNKRTEISTLSKWESESHLNSYRNSILFGKIWPETKKLFSDKPTTTSFQVLTEV